MTMAPPTSRPPSLPCIPDIDLDLDEKAHLLPELEDFLSAAGESSTTLDEEDNFLPSRSQTILSRHSSCNAHHRRRLLPSRLPSISSTTFNVLPPPSPRRVDLAYQGPSLQLRPTQKSLLESWTITYHHPTPRSHSLFQLLGITVWRKTELDEAGSVLSVSANTHLSQGELEGVVRAHTEAHGIARAGGSDGAASDRRWGDRKQRGRRRLSKLSGGGVASKVEAYAADLQARIRKLDWKVQDEIYELLSDRVQSSSNAFRRREWKVVVMSEVPGGELTDAPSGLAAASGGKYRRLGSGLWSKPVLVGGQKTPKTPITEYRLILRGAETRSNDQGWGQYNRYSQPWRTADEKEFGERRRWSSVTGRCEKYVDF
ncbi:hypothetical protein VTI74DRAFT_2754 [Chaetomium olivicolor]